MNQRSPEELGYDAPDRPTPQVVSARIGFVVLFIFLASVSLFVIFRPFFISHFDAILADPGDGRFEVTMLEHWTRALHGKVPITSPNFFYPEKGVLGYSDALLGLGIPYAGFRAAGADRYLALELVMMLVTAVGFLGMYRLLLEVLRLPRSTALLGAFLFIISNMYYIDLVHVHLNFAVVAPWLFVLAARFWRARASSPATARLCICLCSLLLALFFYTTFYDAWFLVLCSASGITFYWACVYFVDGPQAVSRMLNELREQTWSFLLGVAVFLIALVPFFALYLPSLHRTGHRSLGETLYFLPRPLGILDVGRDNLVWGRMSAHIQDVISPGGIHEHPTGWPLLTVIVFISTSIYCGMYLWRSRRRNSGKPIWVFYTVSAIALTCLTLWTAGVRVGEHAPVWAVLWRFVPGAAAIRVPQRINLVLNIGVVIVCMFGLEALRRKLATHGAVAYLLPALLAGALIVEQINVMPTHLISRKAEAQEFSKIPPPPKDCAEFYVSNWGDNISRMLVSQTDAMLVAEQYDIPTINGYSSWFPENWNMMRAAKGHVSEEAVDWAKQHGVSNGLCALDMNLGTWSLVDTQRYVSPAYLGEPLAGKLEDSGFEGADLAAWALFQSVRASVSTTEAHSGTQSLAETDGTGSMYQDVSGLQPGQRYRISAWVAASPGATAGGQIAVFDPDAVQAILSKTLHPGKNWELLSDFITVRKDRLRIHLFRTEGTGTVYWDDVRIYPDNESGDANIRN